MLLPAAGAPLRALMVAGLGAAFWQQATGVEAAVYYTPETLERAGITDESSLLLATVGVGAVKVAFIVLAAFWSSAAAACGCCSRARRPSRRRTC